MTMNAYRHKIKKQNQEAAAKLGRAFFGPNGCKERCGRMNCLVKYLKSLMRPEGFEPPTYGFVVRRSIQLSYRRSMLPDFVLIL